MNRKRVVLLARPGIARDRAQAAIAEAGADVAALLDPGAATEFDVRDTAPDVVMVILDPAVEAVLDKFDGVLGDPGFEIMFEDADVAAKREGWEAARWSRHLNAKLYGHEDVLPRQKGEPAMAADEGQRASDADKRFEDEMEVLQLQVAALMETPYAGASAKHHQHGAVVISAGIGGPDAVRQLLGGMLAGFPRPIVLQQRLEGGQYDKLVRQMQRATPLQVVLAQAGDPVQVGTVHVLPEGLGLQDSAVGLVFAPSSSLDFSALLPGESGLLLLSGADLALVDAAMSLGWGGGLVLGQSQENCFDPTASNELVARGGQAMSLSKLPLKLLERWPV